MFWITISLSNCTGQAEKLSVTVLRTPACSNNSCTVYVFIGVPMFGSITVFTVGGVDHIAVHDSLPSSNSIRLAYSIYALSSVRR